MAYEGTTNQHLQDLAGPQMPEPVNMVESINQAMQQSYETADAYYREEQAKREQAVSRAMGYLDQLPDGVDTAKVPSKYKSSIQDWTKGQQMKYADYAEEISIAEQNGDFDSVQHYKRKMGEIEDSFQNLNNNLTNFKSYKDGFLEDTDNGQLSNANNGGKLGLLSSVYSDEMDMSFTDDGSITFTNEEGYVDFNNLPKYTSKNNKGATSIIETNESLFNSGNRLTNSKRLLLKNKLKGLTSNRDELLSLATDDFIIDGGLGIKDPSLLYDKTRTNELRDLVIQNYMDIFNDTANSGYTNKQSRSSSGSSGGTLSEKKYNAAMSNINKGYNLLTEGDTDTLSRVIKGEIIPNEDSPGMYYYLKGDTFIDLHEGIPQNYWGKTDAPSSASSETKDADYYLSQID